MPYISTSNPLALVTSVNVPFLLLRYSACSERRAPGFQSLELITSMSGQPSALASRNAAPEPSVSGRNFLPARPLLCTNLIPAVAVTSVNVTAAPGAGGAAATRPALAKASSRGISFRDITSEWACAREHTKHRNRDGCQFEPCGAATVQGQGRSAPADCVSVQERSRRGQYWEHT